MKTGEVLDSQSFPLRAGVGRVGTASGENATVGPFTPDEIAYTRRAVPIRFSKGGDRARRFAVQCGACMLD